MKILVLNSGSSSLKFKFFGMQDFRVLARGEAERIGTPGAVFVYDSAGKESVRIERPMKDHRAAIELLLSLLADRERGILKGAREIDAVGHRVVHGGEHFRQSVLIDKEKRAALESCSELAPLHNPPNLAGIDVCAELLPGVRQVAVFDTAFHRTIPDFAYTYAVPYRFYEKLRVRKFGFHGISHQYVSSRALEILRGDPASLRLITCHLGAGSSLCAVRGGQSMDTSMGFTPLSGVVMATRSGDIDPALVAYIAEKEKISAEAVVDILNHESGVLGISGLSRDFRDLLKAARDGNERAGLALKVFAYSVARGIGSLIPALGGLDALVFTAGVGENSPTIRSRIASFLPWLGLVLDEKKNAAGVPDSEISAPDSRVRALVIATDEELMIARETLKLIEPK